MIATKLCLLLLLLMALSNVLEAKGDGDDETNECNCLTDEVSSKLKACPKKARKAIKKLLKEISNGGNIDPEPETTEKDKTRKGGANDPDTEAPDTPDTPDCAPKEESSCNCLTKKVLSKLKACPKKTRRAIKKLLRESSGTDE
ncbi:uncharacterized protein LOC131928685 [Physella acuta]|uniref:uncharacterized protein LOC131928685 n=1 Tax=Physella acuta TaxID=109671 RepID=UPI0027DE623A|nr:uncharacterized protein LOC131928685 [Physella acuta]